MATGSPLPLLLLLLLASLAGGDRVTNLPVMALHYNLTLAPFIYSSNASLHHIAASLTIWAKAVTGTNVIYWYWNPTIKGSYRMEDENGTRRIHSSREDIDSWHKVQFDKHLEANDEIIIRLPWYRALVQPLEYLDTDGATKRFAATNLGVSTYDFMPCIVDDRVKVTIDVSIVRRSDFFAVTNSESDGNRTEENVSSWWPSLDASEVSGFSWIVETFATTEPMPVSRFHFVVSQLAQVASRVDSDGRQYRFWSSPASARLLRNFADDAFHLQGQLERMLGSEECTKVDYFLVQSSNLSLYRVQAGNGIVVMGCSSDLARSSQQLRRELMLYGLSKQLARVRLRAIDPLAEAMGYLAVMRLQPQWRTNSWALVDYRPRWWPLRHCADVHDAVCRDFATAAKLLQLRFIVGGEFESSAHYMTTPAYSYNVKFETSTMDYFVKQAGGNDILEYFKSWTTGMSIVTCSVSGTQLTLRQRNLAVGAELWTLPIVMVTSENATELRRLGDERWGRVQWLTQWQQSFVSFNSAGRTPSWYLLNPRGVGLYRVNYNLENWAALARQLRQNHRLLHPLERAALIEDSFELARLGLLNYSVPADIVGYLASERHHLPVLRAAEALLPLVLRQPWRLVGGVACQLAARVSKTLKLENFDSGAASYAALAPAEEDSEQPPPPPVATQLLRDSVVDFKMSATVPDLSGWRAEALKFSYSKLLLLVKGCRLVQG